MTSCSYDGEPAAARRNLGEAVTAWGGATRQRVPPFPRANGFSWVLALIAVTF